MGKSSFTTILIAFLTAYTSTSPLLKKHSSRKTGKKLDLTREKSSSSGNKLMNLWLKETKSPTMFQPAQDLLLISANLIPIPVVLDTPPLVAGMNKNIYAIND